MDFEKQLQLQMLRKRLQVIGIVFGICGYGLLLWASWKVALGTFLVHWSIMLEFKVKKVDEEYIPVAQVDRALRS